MMPLMLRNDVNCKECPLCASHLISKKGDILYGDPIRFSTTVVELTDHPELWKCTVCDSLFTQNRIAENDAIALYLNGQSSERWSKSGASIEKTKPLNQRQCLLEYFLKGKSVLDIGCNTGELLDYAESFGCITTGVEYSEHSRLILDRKGHKNFTRLEDVDEGFDVILAFDLVEHMYDIKAFFSACKKLLKEGGVFIILTGCVESISAVICKSKWWYVGYPEHIVFPSTKYLSEYSGFNVAKKINTYASMGYKMKLTFHIGGIMRRILKGDYNGLPSLGPDHMLVVLT